MSRRTSILILSVLCIFIVTGCMESSSKLLGNVQGKVFDSNGHVLRGAKVEIYGGDLSTVSDDLGHYAICGVEPGQHRIVATYQGRSVVIIVEIPRGGTLEGADLTFAVIDGLPPVITDVKIATLTENMAQITWVTSEPADSIVDYATGPIGLGTYTFQATDTAMLLNHSMDLTGLSPNITYHFRVRSRDFAGNEGVSSDYQFITPGGQAPSTPLNFAIVPPTEMEKISFTWTSNTESDLAGYNLYRAETKSGTFVRVNADPIASVGTSMSYQDEGLKIAWKYYYYLKAVDTAKNESQPTAIQSLLTPGSLAENRTWTFDDSPYIVTGDIRVRGGAVLTVEPGVEVKFSQIDNIPDANGATMTDLIVQGALKAVGTADRKILFTSAETFPSKGNWGGIKFLSTNEPDNQLRYSTVMFADTGVRSEGSTPAIENSDFGLCVIGLDLGLSTALNIRYNTFRDCNLGVVSANSNIRNNLFVNNQVGLGIFGSDYLEQNTIDCLIAMEVVYGEPTIKNNIITHTGGKGIYAINQTQTTATPSISYNDIYNFDKELNGVTVATGPGNIASDPLFIAGLPYDYHLQTVAAGYASDSPCLKSGESGVQMGRYGP